MVDDVDVGCGGDCVASRQNERRRTRKKASPKQAAHTERERERERERRKKGTRFYPQQRFCIIQVCIS
jgi:hypothetical protein